MTSSARVPKVSVCVITYNQEKYIRQCLQSILDQETDFDFEVIVGDDYSTDGTREIVQEFARQYPQIVRVIFQKINTGGGRNFMDVHEAARGQYIAHVDGDDYILRNKIAVQASYLDKHPNCNIVWHRVAKLVDAAPAKFPVKCTIVNALIFNKTDMLAIGSIGYHSSKMYRATCRNFYKEKIKHGFDYELDLLLVGNGQAALISRVLGVYRVGLGISSVTDSRARRLLDDVATDNFVSDETNKGQISSMLLLLALADAKNRRSYWRRSVKNYLNHFHFLSIYFLLRYAPIRLLLRIWQRT